MKRLWLGFVGALLFLGCGADTNKSPVVAPSVATSVASSVASSINSSGETIALAPSKDSLLEARRGFQTKLTRRESVGEPVPAPPPELAQIVHYDAPPGKMSAYLTVAPQDGQRHPAIIWISGGDCNTIDDGFFSDAPADNDQTASAFRRGGIITMYLSLRGGNDNPGVKEGFFGEVDDVLGALDYLKNQDFVDAKRIYLGGHSTGATLALLVAASTDRFRAIFSFGPAATVAGYGEEFLPFDVSDRRELELRSPVMWMHAIQSRTFVFEGMEQPSNLNSLKALSRVCRDAPVQCFGIKGMSHFSILAPLTSLVAHQILRDTGPTTTIEFDPSKLDILVKQ